MILTGHEIQRQVEAGRIQISPFTPEQLNPNSYNYRIGRELIELTDQPLDPRKRCEQRIHQLPEEGFLIHPRRLYLAHTAEQIGSQHYVTTLIGRSTMGRLGLWLQISADLGHLGPAHRWTLELKVVQPLWLYPGMLVGQVSFWRPRGSRSLLYTGKYAQHLSAEPSHIHVEFQGPVSSSPSEQALELAEPRESASLSEAGGEQGELHGEGEVSPSLTEAGGEQGELHGEGEVSPSLTEAGGEQRELHGEGEASPSSPREPAEREETAEARLWQTSSRHDQSGEES